MTLGGGLLIFASVLSDAYFERPRRQHVINDVMEKMTSSSSFDYKYGWSFVAAGAAFIMSEIAAVLSMSAYLRRFPTVEDMVIYFFSYKKKSVYSSWQEQFFFFF